MTKKVTINRPVDVTAVYFNNRRGMDAYPRRIEFDDQTYTFRDGMQCRVSARSGRNFRQFDMCGADGSTFSLRCSDGGADWTLLTITQEV